MSCLDLALRVDGQIIETSPQKLAFVHFVEPVVLEALLLVNIGTESQPVEALAKEELARSVFVEQLGHVMVACRHQTVSPVSKRVLKLFLSENVHLFKELPAVEPVTAVHTDQSRKDAGFFDHAVLRLEDFYNLLLMDLLVSVHSEGSQHSAVLESLVQFSLHDLSALSFTESVDVVPPTVEQSAQPAFSDFFGRLRDELCPVLD